MSATKATMRAGAAALQQPAKPSLTAGMTLGRRIAHIGGTVKENGMVEFGSVMAVAALVEHVLRDAARQPAASLWRVGACTFDNLSDVREFLRTDMTGYPVEAYALISAAAVDREPAAASGVGQQLPDAIAMTKRILALVDEYHDKPTQYTRTALRMALTLQFQALGVPSSNFPVLYVSEEQLPVLGTTAAQYVSYRLNPEGKFQLPLYRLPVPGAALAAAPAAAPDLGDELHGRIMNLPCRVPTHDGVPYTFDRAYKLGHRDARHAAAELVGEVQAAAPQAPAAAQPVAWSQARFIHDSAGYAIGTDDPEVHWGAEPPDAIGWSPLYGEEPAAAQAQPDSEQVEILRLEAENALTSIANDLQASYDSDGITEQDSGAPLVYLSAALAAVESARQEFRVHGAAGATGGV